MPDPLQPEPPSPADAGNPASIINRSGGADLNAGRDITVSGDIVGHDKITHAEQIDTGGGTYVEGDVTAQEFVGRDKIVITEEVAYKVHGLANPYLGLQSFTYADHAKYAGREKLIAETVARLAAPADPLALLFITGASGSGKSSFVQAGVLPALEKHYSALSVKWAVFRPSRDPLSALADVLWRQLGLPQYDASTDFGDFLQAHTPAQQVNVIVIDQFEELFTQSNAQPRDALFNLLTHLPPFRTTHTHFIVTVRADYLPELFALPALYDIAKRGIDLRAMSVDELREAIQQPLRATYPDKDKRFQAELVERLAHDSAEDAAYLPLLQVTLEEIWRKGTLTVGSYTNLADAIKQRADKVLAYQDYDAAQPDRPRSLDEQNGILNLCLDLVDVSLDDEARRDVRRRRSKDELISGAPERARLIDALTQARLLSVSTEDGEPTRIEVDLIHETLLSIWDRLRQAIAEHRHELRQRVHFEQQLKEWIGQHRSDDYLLSGVRLAEAQDLERRDDIALRSAEARDFVRLSKEQPANRPLDREIDRLLLEVRNLLGKNSFDEAARRMRRNRIRYPGIQAVEDLYLEAHYLLGVHLFAKYDLPQAKSAFQAVLDIDPFYRDANHLQHEIERRLRLEEERRVFHKMETDARPMRKQLTIVSVLGVIAICIVVLILIEVLASNVLMVPSSATATPTITVAPTLAKTSTPSPTPTSTLKPTSTLASSVIVTDNGWLLYDDFSEAVLDPEKWGISAMPGPRAYTLTQEMLHYATSAIEMEFPLRLEIKEDYLARLGCEKPRGVRIRGRVNSATDEAGLRIQSAWTDAGAGPIDFAFGLMNGTGVDEVQAKIRYNNEPSIGGVSGLSARQAYSLTVQWDGTKVNAFVDDRQAQTAIPVMAKGVYGNYININFGSPYAKGSLDADLLGVWVQCK